MAARLGDFMAARGIAATAVLGHSMGGKVAMALALEAADAVGALIVVDVAPVATKPTMAPFVDAMRAIPLAASARCAEVGAGLATAVPDDWVRAFLLQNLVADGDGLRWRVNLDAIAAGMDAISGFPDFADGTVYGGPTLFVTGAASDYVRPRHDAVIRRLFPRAETVAIAGHWVHADAPDAFTDTVAGFLESA
jgi:pimeloyl-ACP methyl ester carboxylesterase